MLWLPQQIIWVVGHSWDTSKDDKIVFSSKKKKITKMFSKFFSKFYSPSPSWLSQLKLLCSYVKKKKVLIWVKKRFENDVTSTRLLTDGKTKSKRIFFLSATFLTQKSSHEHFMTISTKFHYLKVSYLSLSVVNKKNEAKITQNASFWLKQRRKSSLGVSELMKKNWDKKVKNEKLNRACKNGPKKIPSKMLKFVHFGWFLNFCNFLVFHSKKIFFQPRFTFVFPKNFLVPWEGLQPLEIWKVRFHRHYRKMRMKTFFRLNH